MAEHKVRGKYVGTISIDFEWDAGEPGVLTTEKLKESLVGGEFTQQLIEYIQGGVSGFATVGVEQQFADLYEADN